MLVGGDVGRKAILGGRLQEAIQPFAPLLREQIPVEHGPLHSWITGESLRRLTQVDITVFDHDPSSVPPSTSAKRTRNFLVLTGWR